MRGHLLALALALVGCYRPAPQEGAPCTSAMECPAPLVCEQGVCVRDPAGAVDAAGGDGDLPNGCSCNGDTLVCPTGETQCPTGCSTVGGAHCASFVPSNGADLGSVAALTVPITIDGNANFNGDTGKINGAISRTQGEGVNNGIGYLRTTFMGADLAVFSFRSLDVTAAGRIQLSGARAIVFVVGGDVTVAGEIDAGAPCASGNCPGPGGGSGSTLASPGGGCGGGAGGISDATSSADSGGGGGGGGEAGAPGGSDTRTGTTFAGGAGGAACVPARLEPLRGGSGGAGGGDGSTTATRGGAGGGALQITALGAISISGTITAGGAGGEPGPGDAATSNAGGGGGGGAGGSILLEARAVTLAAGGVLAANGGGGGGGGSSTLTGQAGQHGIAGMAPAAGGAGASANPGGAGGAVGAAAQPGMDQAANNAGGGGGGAGRIYLRAFQAPALAGAVSPAAGIGAL